MTRKNIFKITAALFIFIAFCSCRKPCECNCDKCLGCYTLTARTASNDSLIIQKKYCTKTSIYNDKALEDSINSFMNRYSQTYKITSKDSTYNCESKEFKCKETHEDYLCTCMH